MKFTTVLVTSSALILGGCATAAKDIAPTYVSPIQYQSYDCQQIEAENARIEFNDSASPARVLDDKDSGAQYVLMPLRV